MRLGIFTLQTNRTSGCKAVEYRTRWSAPAPELRGRRRAAPRLARSFGLCVGWVCVTGGVRRSRRVQRGPTTTRPALTRLASWGAAATAAPYTNGRQRAELKLQRVLRVGWKLEIKQFNRELAKHASLRARIYWRFGQCCDTFLFCCLRPKPLFSLS